ncbi:MAG: phosphoketolase family protein, partial [Patescibacteria group bacterium]
MATSKNSKSEARNPKQALAWFDKYLRYTDYIAAAQLYLKDNFLLKRPLSPEHIKDRILGHWGTVPGLSFIYAHCDYLIKKHGIEMLYMAGPGHGAPAVLANVFAEGSMGDFYEEYQRDRKGMAQIIKDFSWPCRLPSHVTPMTPGGILEGGELGYSLSTAYGAVMDNPNLVVACVVGDGEAESGPLAAAWHSNKFLNAKESGAVLPILHINGYKISGPTIYGTMKDQEIENLFTGFGYQVKIVEGAHMHEKMMEATSWAYREITKIQKKARSGGSVIAPHWPMIVLRSIKGWGGIKTLDGKKVEGNFRSHGIPVADPKTNPEHLKILEHWLRSYQISELVDSRGCPKPEVLEFVPTGNLRMGKNKHAIGGNVRKPLKFPDLRAYQVDIKNKPGEVQASNTAVGAEFIKDIFKENDAERNFRFMCPDETDSNKMGALFKTTGRAYVWPLHSYDEFMSTNGRVMEMLSEHTLQGWLQGYLMTGRHGMFATYEAFAMIVASMVDQYAKFIKQSSKVPWRKPISSLNYLLTSLGWRQEHNGYSHQNPGFISAVLEKHGEFCSVYFPPDGNSFLVTLEDCFKRKDSINVIVAGKQNMPQWLTLDEAKKQLKKGAGVW